MLTKSQTAQFVLACILVCPTSLAGQDTKPQVQVPPQFDGFFRPSGMPGLDEAYLPTLFPSSHAANFLVLKDEDILCFWFSGIGEGHSNGISMSRLSNGSQQWGTPMEVDHQDGRSFQNPVAFQEPGGRIWLLHTSQVAGQWQTNATVEYLTSDDNGKTWSNRKTLFDKPGSFVRQPPILLSAKHWLLPIYYTPSRSITDGAESNYSAVKITTDGGAQWKECAIPKSEGLVQQSILKVHKDHFVGFFRSRYADFIYQSTSRDGCAWTVPVPTPLPNNNSSIQGTLLRDGAIAIVFNNSSAGTARDKPRTAARKPLSVVLSKDNGKTWPWIRNLETGAPEDAGQQRKKSDEYSYPTVLQDAGGQIYVAYTYRHQTIKVVRFHEDWIPRRSVASGATSPRKKDE
jgi:predicted neuraminidase